MNFSNQLLRSVSKLFNTPKAIEPQAELVVDRLESRLMLSSNNVFQDAGLLTIFANVAGNQTIDVRLVADDDVRVIINEIDQGTFDLPPEGEIRLYAGDRNNTITFSANLPYDVRVDSGDGDDVIRTGAGNDLIRGGAGNDTIFARAGDDLILSGSGDDLVYAQAGDDMVSDLSGGNDTVFGGAGDDELSVGITLDVDADDDVVFGGTGNDVIRGRVGNDILDGGSGGD